MITVEDTNTETEKIAMSPSVPEPKFAKINIGDNSVKRVDSNKQQSNSELFKEKKKVCKIFYSRIMQILKYMHHFNFTDHCKPLQIINKCLIILGYHHFIF